MASDHLYTPKTFQETASTLSCHQMANLAQRDDESITPAEMGRFQAAHLLEAGYVISYEPELAEELLKQGIKFGYIGRDGQVVR